ncbi:MAG: DUF126 domain-containing protein [Candidatus Fermentimicrarchaeum limneticum]|uniref:Phosphomevalonate dehydratase small subunit n=1 Tax=Fermentimicrarchaeum limneticum TaxID=2795018 RepID=A0A7D6BG47_FERL1|nr:MAG: DUF126 domain-containing protein [Candidatus Fermentimicrarchaeum limneticum]
MVIRGRVISKGKAEGEALVSREEISFLGEVDTKTGVVTNPKHQLFNKSIAGRILVFPRGRGSTVGSYALYQLKKNGKAPKAIINEEAEVIVAVGAIISEIPMVDKLEKNAFRLIKDGSKLVVDGNKGVVVIK